jgi:hypothetical protein
VREKPGRYAHTRLSHWYFFSMQFSRLIAAQAV